MCNTRLFQWAGCVLLLQSTQLQAAESILWRNSATGQNQRSLYQTLAESAATPLNQVSDPQWQVATSGDFNGDGDDDLLWRHQSSGANHLYLMQQGKITSQHPLNTVADLNWSVAGSGDFNGDGKDDLLWRNQVTGLNWLYFLNGTTIEHQARLNQIADPQWQVAAIADLDADHKADIIWRHQTTGQNYLYLMDGNSIKAQRYLNTVPTDAWQLSAAQDFDGDGRADLLWRNVQTGANYLYLMDGLNIRSVDYINTVSTEWQIAAVLDINGDQRADILWHNTNSGDLYGYLMDGAQRIAVSAMGSRPSGDGSIAAVLHQDNSSVTHDNQVVTQLYFQATDNNPDNTPFSIGQVFKAGDLPQDAQLLGRINDTAIPLQTSVKARYADGSAKHAIISGQLPATQTHQQVTVDLIRSTDTISLDDPILDAQQWLDTQQDLQLDLHLYQPQIINITLGDRATSWQAGEQVDITLNGTTYSATTTESGTGLNIASTLAKALCQQLSDVTVQCDTHYDVITLLRADNYSLSAQSSGNVPITLQTLQTYAAPVDYSVSLQQAVQDAIQADTLTIWDQGPLSAQWLIKAPLRNPDTQQIDPQLMARFYITVFKGYQTLKTDVVLENNWAFAAAPNNRLYDVRISEQDNTLFQQDQVYHYSHSRWKKTIWQGQMPHLNMRHDQAYLINSKALPNYDPNLVVDNSDVQPYRDGWQGEKTHIMHIGNATAYMPGTGAHDDIGPLPRWQALYLLSMDPSMKSISLAHGDLAGTWSIHYRDQKTDLPVSIQDYPYMTIVGNPSDTYNPTTERYESFPSCAAHCRNPFVHDTAHQPDFAYLPYLVTGDYYYLEELLFWVSYNNLQSNPGYRQAEQGLLHKHQIRGQAWLLRTLARAAYITPDNHPQKTQLNTVLSNNFAYYNSKYSHNDQANALGINLEGAAFSYNNKRGIAPWQDDFFTWAIGHAVELGFSQAAPLLQWKAKFPIQRMTDDSYCWISAAPYTLTIRDSQDSPIYATLGEAYQASISDEIRQHSCASQAMADQLGLQLNEMTGYASAPAGYPANMQPALAVATDTHIDNAQTAWQTFANRSVKPDYSNYPNWAIVPRDTQWTVDDNATDNNTADNSTTDDNTTDNNTTDNNTTDNNTTDNNATDDNTTDDTTNDNTTNDNITVAALHTLSSGHWLEAPNTLLEAVIPDNVELYNANSGYSSIVTAWSGGTLDTKRNRMLIWGGGHQDYKGNEVYAFDIPTMQWTRSWGPSAIEDIPHTNTDAPSEPLTVHEYLDGTPSSRHTYDGITYIPEPYDVMWEQGGSAWRSGYSSPYAWQFDLKTLSWQKLPRAPESGFGVSAIWDPQDQKVYHRGNYNFHSYDPANNSWETIWQDGGGFWNDGTTAILDPKRHRMILIGQGELGYLDLDTYQYHLIQASGDTQIIDKEAPGFAYHPGTDSAIAWFGGETVYQLNLDTWHWQAKTAASDNQTIPAQGVSRGTFGRFRYVPDYDVFILVNDVRQNVLFYKL